MPAISFQQIRDQTPAFPTGVCRGRYAPSPSGPLHLGNLRTALLAWLQVRLNGGRLILRMEDLDQPRMKAGCAQAMLEELQWLGLDWDEGPPQMASPGPFIQSQRTPIYEAALDQLRGENKVYRCYCSRRDIAQAASAPHASDRQPPYPGTCSHLTPAQEEAVQRSKPDRKPAWRFRAPKKTYQFKDRIAGPVRQQLDRDVGDFVVKRADGLFAYQLAVVVDDGLMGINHVLRGADLLDSSPRQIALFEALHLTIPTFWHVPLVQDRHGQRLAKRDGAQGLAMLRQQGFQAENVIGMLASSLGWVAPDQVISAKDLLTKLTRDRFLASLRSHDHTLDSYADPDRFREP